jgi:hypothetical protein
MHLHTTARETVETSNRILLAAELGASQGDHVYLLPIDTRARFCPNSSGRRTVRQRSAVDCAEHK